MDPQTLMMLLQMMQQNPQMMQGMQGMGGMQGQFQDPLSALLTLGMLPFSMGTLQTPWNMQMKAAQTAMNPGAFMARYGQFYRPLSQQLINNVTEAVGPSMAARGMTQSPGQIAGMLGTALAPQVMAQQAQAANLASGTMQFPFQGALGAAASAYPASLGNLGATTGSALNELLNAYNDYNQGVPQNPFTQPQQQQTQLPQISPEGASAASGGQMF